MGISLIPLNCTVKNGYCDQFYVTYIHSATIKNNCLKIHLNLHLKPPFHPPLSFYLLTQPPQRYSNNKHCWHRCGERTDGRSLAAGSSQEGPRSEKQMAGCSQTHGASPSLGSQKFHAAVYSKEVSHHQQESRRYGDVCGCSENTRPWVLILDGRTLGHQDSDSRDHGENSRLPGAQRAPRGPAELCSFLPSCPPEKGKTRCSVCCRSRGLPANLQRSDKQICASWCWLICFQ